MFRREKFPHYDLSTILQISIRGQKYALYSRGRAKYRTIVKL